MYISLEEHGRVLAQRDQLREDLEFIAAWAEVNGERVPDPIRLFAENAVAAVFQAHRKDPVT